MADWSLPTLTSTYANFRQNLTDRDLDAITQCNNGTPTNIPTNAIKWDTGLNRWTKWSGSAWAELASTYALTGVTCTSLSNTGNTTLGDSGADSVTCNASTMSVPNGLSITGTVTFGTAIPVASGGTGAADAATARTNLGVPSTTGTGASGSWGISVTGSAASVNGNIQGTLAGNLTWTAGANILIGGESSFDLSSGGTFGVFDGASGAYSIKSAYNQQVEIGSAGTQGLKVWGAITATGEITAFSDERLKTNWRSLPENFVERLASTKSGVFDRTDVNLTQVGVGAQSLQELIPEAVLENADGTLSVSYGNAALAACVELAKELVAVRKELAELKGSR